VTTVLRRGDTLPDGAGKLITCDYVILVLPELLIGEGEGGLLLSQLLVDVRKFLRLLLKQFLS
jgi:hypothetical protein